MVQTTIRIIPTLPSGPRGVRHVFIAPGIGASPYDQRRYFCGVCKDFTGATGENGDVCTVNPNHPLRRKKKRGRPSPWGPDAQNARYNRARTVYANYLSSLSYLRFVVWWYSHAPEDYVERFAKRESYNLARVFSERVKWDRDKLPSELAIALLARKLRKRKSTVRQLIKEGQWWDRIEKEHGVGFPIRVRTRDRYQELLEDGRRLLRRSRHAQLTPAQANNLFLRLPPAIDAATLAHIETLIEQVARSRRARD